MKALAFKRNGDSMQTVSVVPEVQTLRLSQAGIAVELRGIPHVSVTEPFCQGRVSRFIKVKPARQFAFVGSNLGYYVPLVRSKPNTFEHMYAVSATLIQSPRQHWQEQSRGSIKRLKIN